MYEAPYHETLVALYALEEMERIDALQDELRALDQLYGINGAVLNARLLRDMSADLQRRLLMAPTASTSPLDPATLAAHLYALGARMKVS